ncbi:hypothetical protein HUT06_26140 [Actinomadura sp. NAK00032]|uniref:hypothetical protein n=1 Tax=Actinomadura sp. NAK00032 TaxID=2742128 RepID=UPI001591684B|nr:hypothetical protein [Actinomadura sp. NAK00032]QKW37062.1 hypothetical protein HUT06_26140 [Actinomadura sp. NAK00032]
MAQAGSKSGLPDNFLYAIAKAGSPDSPAVRMVVERVRAMDASLQRDDLLLVLLCETLTEVAPEWMLRTATETDLGREVGTHRSDSMKLAAAALSHPSCSDALREEFLARCTAPQLATLGRADSTDAMVQAIVTEIQRRGPHGQPMTRELSEKPGTAQLILREPGLHDDVFAAAVALLPRRPEVGEDTGGDAEWEAFEQGMQAWQEMWGRLVTVHVHRHRELVDRTRDTPTQSIIRNHLLGTIPWNVDQALLEELAAEDLARFERSVLITRLCRTARDGASAEEARALFADKLGALTADDRHHVEEYLTDTDFLLEFGCRSAVSWTRRAADHTWRYLLNPAEATNRYGDPRTWRASEDSLAELGRRFAAAAVRALELWEAPDSRRYREREDIRWVHAMLLHLPHLTDEVRAKVRLVLQGGRQVPEDRWRAGRILGWNDERRLSELHAAIERIIADPTVASREKALGDPRRVSARDLAATTDDVLQDYLSRHTDDVLVEKALLSFAHRPRSQLAFADVLHRHPAPQTAILQITMDLRSRLGGGPNLREAWTRTVLALPDCSDELVRALPAWTVLSIGGGSGYSPPLEAVTSVVMTALGEDEAAWARFAANPSSHAGPNAWLQLGEILDASRSGTPWPNPRAPRRP